MNLILAIIVILLVIFLWNNRPESRKETKGSYLLLNLDDKLRKIVEASGYSTRYRLVEHPSSNYTQGKQDIHICTNCVASEDKLIYIGLHEIAHTICKTSRGVHSHDDRWNQVFRNLLETSTQLGYLDSKGLRPE